MYIIGISAFYHDSAACLLKDGDIIAAAQEERFTRKKHDESFPSHSIKYCLAEAGISGDDVANIVFYEKPFVKFERLLETYLAFAPRGFKSFLKAMPSWITDKLFLKSKIIAELEKIFGKSVPWSERLLFSEHHLSHAASAYYPSPFEHSAVLTLDGVGEWASTSIAVGNGKDLKIIKEIHFPHSLGLLYSAFTYYLGFKVNSGEYKVMGLAPYGEPKYAKSIIENLIKVADDGSFQLDMSYFNFATDLTMTNKKFDMLFGGLPRTPETELAQREMDLAASIQKVTEDILLKIVKDIAKETSEKNLCLAGGVALNCVANGFLLREKIFEKIWIQPASGDAGGALGAALAVWHLHHGKERHVSAGLDAMKGSYLGPSFSSEEVEAQLISCGAKFCKLEELDLIERVVSAIEGGKAVGWMQGRMEFGPRALGGRSIIADPRSSEMQKKLNLKVKYRESFRPFAPSVLSEHVSEWFELYTNSPYMLMVADVQKSKRNVIPNQETEFFGIDRINTIRSEVPAITHVDNSARIQTVHRETNPRYHSVISRLYEKTNCPLVVNTSFNVRGEPIICSPTDAFKCFMGTELDVLVVEDYFLIKEEQNQMLNKGYEKKYELD